MGSKIRPTLVRLASAVGAALAGTIADDAPGAAVQIAGRDPNGKLRALALGSAYQLLGLPAALGAAAPGASLPVVQALTTTGATCQRSITSTAKQAVPSWVKNTAVVAEVDVQEAHGNIYVCKTSGTTANVDGAGPSSTSADITDGTAHWSYVCAAAACSVMLQNYDPAGANAFWGFRPGVLVTSGTPLLPNTSIVIPYGTNPSTVYLVSAGTVPCSATVYA